MIKAIWNQAFALTVLMGCGLVTPAMSEEYAFPNSEVFEMTSAEGLEYRIFLSKPVGASPEGGFPVLYVLDGNAYFPLATSLVRQQLRGPGSAIVVGIGYPTDGAFDMARRTLDLTTKASPEKLPPSRGGRGWSKSGGADAFLQFIQKELKPEIAKRCQVHASNQAIIGHSFGGLFVMHSLFTQPDAFQTYLALSPSGWWNDFALLQEEKQFANRVESLKVPVRLMIAVGELELNDGEGPAAALAPTAAKREFGTTVDFAKRLEGLQSERFQVRYRVLEGENHGTVIAPAMIDALRFAFPPNTAPRTRPQSPSR